MFIGRGESVSGHTERTRRRPRFEWAYRCFAFLREYPAVWIATLIFTLLIVLIEVSWYIKGSGKVDMLTNELEFALQTAGYHNFKTVKGNQPEDYLAILTAAVYNRGEKIDVQQEVKYFIQFNRFNMLYNRVHESNLDKVNKFKIFRANTLRLLDQFQRPERSYLSDWNQFADMTSEEFMKLHITSYIPSEGHTAAERNPGNRENHAGSNVEINYRDYRLTPVKDQGNTGHAWAFAATGALEALLRHRGNPNVTLSEQQLIDCVAKSHRTGKPDPIFAYEYLKNTGVNRSDVYPFTGERGECSPVAGKHSYRITKFERVADPDLITLLQEKGPLTVYVSVDEKWQFYKSGVLDSCGTEVNHAALLVGVGEGKNGKYWLLKNSWGTDWGKHGYVKVARGSGKIRDECGLAHAAIYPVEIPEEDVTQDVGMPTTIKV